MTIFKTKFSSLPIRFFITINVNAYFAMPALGFFLFDVPV